MYLEWESCNKAAVYSNYATGFLSNLMRSSTLKNIVEQVTSTDRSISITRAMGAKVYKRHEIRMNQPYITIAAYNIKKTLKQ